MQVDLGRIGLGGLDDVGKIFAGILAPEHRVERDHDPGIEEDALADFCQRLLPRIRKAKAARARAAGEFELQPRGAVFEIVQRLGIGLRRRPDGRPAA